MTQLTGTVLCFLLIVAIVGSAGALFLHSRRKQTNNLHWFRITPAPGHLWEPAEAVSVNRDALLAPLLIADTDPTPLMWTHPIDGCVFLGVPERTAASLPFAASACGMFAREALAPSTTDRMRPLPEHFEVPGSPPWQVGLLRSGDVLALNPMPGTTIAICAESAVLTRIGQDIHWHSSDYTLIEDRCSPADANAKAPFSLRDAWEAAWDPTTVRVVLCPLSIDATTALLHREDVTAEDVVRETQSGVLADVVLILGAEGTSQLFHREFRRSFSAVGRRPGARHASPALEQPAANPPGNPPARGSTRFLGLLGQRSSAPLLATDRR